MKLFCKDVEYISILGTLTKIPKYLHFSRTFSIDIGVFSECALIIKL